MYHHIGVDRVSQSQLSTCLRPSRHRAQVRKQSNTFHSFQCRCWIWFPLPRGPYSANRINHKMSWKTGRNARQFSKTLRGLLILPLRFRSLVGCTLQTESTIKYNKKQDGTPANCQKRSEVFLYIFSFVSHRRSHFLGIFVSNGIQNGTKMVS